ncbi:hypothetical protein [Serratia proteamaculans]|uniref:hypothetical protein n=1 Tax=Serratia proteamaculans TaxID=28151 RepID=UPI0010215AE9|nr:hypothetical protein [Serratia proteamaculans]RYM50746.1 hypothetical protein BSQ97_15415 [Serratia proteamaculans]
MLVLLSDISADNNNAPRWVISKEETDILRLKPSAWLEATSGVVSSGGKVSAVRDKTGKTAWMHTASNPPLIKMYNGIPVLNFWRAVSNSGALLAEGGYQAIPADGIYSLFILYRIPVEKTEGYSGVGGNIAGNNEAVGEWLRVRFGSDSYEGNVIFLNHGDVSVTGTNNYPINKVLPGWRDAQWHISTIQAGADFHRWEIDGALHQETTFPAKPFPTEASRQLVIGGACNPLSNGFQGDIAAVLLLPGELREGAKTLIYDRLNAMKTALTESSSV